MNIHPHRGSRNVEWDVYMQYTEQYLNYGLCLRSLLEGACPLWNGLLHKFPSINCHLALILHAGDDVWLDLFVSCPRWAHHHIQLTALSQQWMQVSQGAVRATAVHLLWNVARFCLGEMRANQLYMMSRRNHSAYADSSWQHGSASASSKIVPRTSLWALIKQMRATWNYMDEQFISSVDMRTGLNELVLVIGITCQGDDGISLAWHLLQLACESRCLSLWPGLLCPFSACQDEVWGRDCT